MIKQILKSAILPTKPVHLILHVTGKCNLRCRTCFVDFDKYEGNGKELSLDEIGRVAEYLDELIWLDISGGEPFLRKDLPDICEKFNAGSITIPTNGFNPTLIAETTKKIRERTDTNLSIVISIDGFEETNDRIRDHGCYQKSIETLELLKKIDGIRIKINTVICEENYDEMIDFMKFVKQFELDFHSIIFLRGESKDPLLKKPSYEKLLAIKSEIFKMWNTYNYGFKTFEGKVLLNYQKEMYETSLRIMKEKKQIPKCLAGKHHLVIYPDGDAAFCEMRSPFGNIKETGMAEILSSNNAHAQRKSISNRECYCHHNCNMVDNFFLNPIKYPQLIYRRQND